MYYKRAVICASIVFVIACKSKQSTGFEVTGNIKHATGKQVLLMETPYGNEQPVVLDSTTLNDKGEFSLKGRANEEGIFRLIVDKGPDLILVNDNDHLKVDLDVNDYKNYRVSGSPASESLQELFKQYASLDSSIMIGFRTIDSIRHMEKLPNKDSLLEAKSSENDKRIEALNNLLRDYINNSPSPAASLFVLGIASQTIGREELKELVNNTAARFPKHTGLSKVKGLMATAKPAQPDAPGAGTYKLLNQQAPNLSMTGLDGKTISISDFRGKYLLVDFWASWCGPCRQENPNVVAAFNQFKSKNFTILGVSLDQDKDAWQQAVTKDALTWNHMSDLKSWSSAAVEPYGIEGIPFNVLIDPTGKIIANDLRGEDLQKKLAEVLK